jgi:cell division protein FtsI (penicillin-binding protein 3)/stage V sporulation protein D (sporulation-specific penicillin-binding protein)
MRWNAQARAVTVSFGLVGAFSVFSFRLVDLQIVRHEEYTALAAEKHVHKQVIYARRGIIRDVHYEPLAENVPVKTVVADASHMRDPIAVAKAIADQLKMDPQELAAKLKTGRKYIVLKREVSEEAANQLKEALRIANLGGIFFEQDFVRTYPNGPLLSQVIGFVDHDHKGALGIERTMQDLLQGTNGFRYTEQDRTGKELVPYRGLESAAKDGCDVTLTIDLGLQNIVENELDRAMDEYKPKGAIAIMIRPQTGEIMAMASRPTFDLNHPGQSDADETKNRAVVYMVEPGSVFKIVPVSAALNEKLVTPDTTIFCENGHFMYGGRVLRDAEPQGVLTVHGVLQHSSNIGAAKLGLQLGENRLYDYARRFGFGQKTGIALTGEISGLLSPPQHWSKLEITRIPMGQSVAVTPLQMVMAMACVSNNGKLMKPMIVSQITDPTGRVVATYSPEVQRQVVKPETCRKVIPALQDVVAAGTAKSAVVPGFKVAGKTGTAQKIDPKGGYMSGHYVSSFIGFLPADDPKFVLLVTLDDPTVKGELAFGGRTAAPVFSQIAARAVSYMDLKPTESVPPPTGPKKVALARRGRH